MEIQENQQESWSEAESTDSRSSRVGFSGPLVSNKQRNGRFKDDDGEMVEITLDVRDDSVSVQNIRGGDSETVFLASRLEKKPTSLSARLRQVSMELKRMTSFKTFDKVDRSKSGAARALQGFKFMTKTVGTDHEGWSQVENRFHQLALDGKLPKTRFSHCIGMFYIIFFIFNYFKHKLSLLAFTTIYVFYNYYFNYIFNVILLSIKKFILFLNKQFN